MNIIFPFLTAYLYRLGGGEIIPFDRGYKWFRRYLIPLAIFLYKPDLLNLISMSVLCVILHFNLDEIEEKDWDDVFCYGLAQACCLFHIAGIFAFFVGITWLLVVLASNTLPEKLKLDWKAAELIHGFVIGFVCTI